MKTYYRILALLLVFTLGTATACSSDEPNSKNNNNSEQLADTGSSDKDVENTDNKDVDNTDDKDVEKDTDEKDTDEKDIDEKDTADVPPDPEENKTPLKDLTDQQVLDLCVIDANKVNDFFDPANETGVAYCLLFAAYAAYDDGSKAPAEMIGQCQATMASCTGDYGSTPAGKCINKTGCKATVAEFERCSNDNVASFAAQTNTLIGKTCSDYTTEQSHQSLDTALDAYAYPQSCAVLISKCPKIYEM